MALFRRSAEEPLAVSMVAVKLGQRLLGVGTRNPRLIAQLAVKAGLTGRACIVDADEDAVAQATAAIEQEGALVEGLRAPYGMWPFDDASFDVAVVPDLLPALTADVRVLCLTELLRVLRPGGRVIVVERARRGGIVGILGARATAGADPSYPGPVAALRDSGFQATRLLAETDGIVYAEGIKRG